MLQLRVPAPGGTEKARPMKTSIAILVCVAVGFGGWQMYVWSQKPEKPEKAEEAKPVENPPPREEPPRRPVVRHTPSSSPKPPRKETTSKPPAKKTTPTTTASKTKSKPPAQVYFTAEEIYPNGIPDRIVIHNMPEVGQTYTLHLVGV